MSTKKEKYNRDTFYLCTITCAGFYEQGRQGDFEVTPLLKG